jgi:hypothetical protein
MLIEVDEELRDLIPDLDPEEKRLLRESLSSEGCREPITVWDEKNIVVDGHNRIEICDELGIEYEVRRVSFESRDHVIAWMCANQLGRRNLTDHARADLRGRFYRANKKAHGGDRKSSSHSANLNDGRTSEAQAEIAKVHPATIHRDAKFSEALDQLESAGIRRSSFTDGSRKVSKNHVIELADLAAEYPDRALRAWDKVEDQGPSSGAIKSAIREVNAEEAVERVRSIAPTGDDLITIEHGDFRDLAQTLEPESFDAIVTDPPYPAEYLDTWDGLADVALRVLKPGGWCIAYSGKQHLDEVFRRMTSGGLIYFWQVIFSQTVSPAIHPRSVNTGYKPILIFQKPPLTKPDGYFRDVIRGERVEKGLHEWQQSENGFAWLIETFTNPGDRILEPFSGGGTCPEVCRQLDRFCVAYEIDEGSYAQSLNRVFGDQVAA